MNDSVCWVDGCFKPSTAHFRTIGKWKEIATCPEHEARVATYPGFQRVKKAGCGA